MDYGPEYPFGKYFANGCSTPGRDAEDAFYRYMGSRGEAMSESPIPMEQLRKYAPDLLRGLGRYSC